jgi:hypothetical protein
MLQHRRACRNRGLGPQARIFAFTDSSNETGKWRKDFLHSSLLDGQLWLRENKEFPWDWEIRQEAVHGGHLSIHQWPRKNGCNLNSQTSHVAADSGHHFCIQKARANGSCRWNIWMCAESAGHLSVI